MSLDTHAIKLNDEIVPRMWLRDRLRLKMRKLFPPVDVRDVNAYFDLPKPKREKWGIYLKPYALPCDFLDDTKLGWNEFDRRIQKIYPIQGWFREWFLSSDNPVYWFFHKLNRNIKDIKNNIRRFIRPSHPRFRKAYPRHKWHDLKEAIVDINFALIQDFYHEEISRDFVNWDATEEHKAFRAWIEDAIFWIEKAEPQAQKDLDAAYKNVDRKNRNLPYEQMYGEVNRIEKTIEETNTRILKEMMEHRGFFWT
jgi:hypothetical protein